MSGLNHSGPGETTPGHLEIVCGPMYSGKSSYLRDTLGRLADTGWKCLYINHSADSNRETAGGDDDCKTHNSQVKSMSAKIEVKLVDKLSDLKFKYLDKFDKIGIDEGQFFEDLEVVRKWVIDYGLDILVASLNGDSDMKPFGKVHELICCANTSKHLTATCMHCGLYRDHGRTVRRKAPFTFCFAKKDGQTLVGGSESYIAVCLKCHKTLSYWKESNMPRLEVIEEKIRENFE